MKCYKTELDLNNHQRTACLRHAGAARFVYNWALRRKIDAYEARQKVPTAIDLHRELNVLKKTELPWLYETSKCAPQEALRNLDKAYQGFFRRCKSGAAKKVFPRFKSRKRGIGSFTLTGAIHVIDRTIQLPRFGILRLKEHGYFPSDVEITSATVSERVGRWFVSIQTKEEPIREAGTETLGMDVGIKSLAVLSDGTMFENSKALRAAERNLKHLQRTVSRKQKGSANRKKAIARVARQHYRISCVRKDSLHKVSGAITKRAGIIGMETLNVAGMVRNHHLAKALSDASIAELHRQITYKMKWAGGIVVKANQFYPSSKTCSSCGNVKVALRLSERKYVCESCGVVLDRDLNAAINLKQMAASSVVGSHACGGFRSQAEPVKQEPNTIQGVVLNG